MTPGTRIIPRTVSSFDVRHVLPTSELRLDIVHNRSVDDVRVGVYIALLEFINEHSR